MAEVRRAKEARWVQGQIKVDSIKRQRLRVKRGRWRVERTEDKSSGCAGDGYCDGDMKCHAAAITGFGDDDYHDNCQ